jgi:prophage DNA circulation protein
MNRVGISEAAPIVLRLLKNLSVCIGATGLPGSQARTAIGDVAANVALLLSSDSLGPPLANCFSLVVAAGATQPQLDQVRVAVTAETPQTLGGIMVQNSCIGLCLAFEGQVIAGMTFVSRQDVDALKTALRQPFDEAEETAADDMDQAAFMALIALDAAITNFLVTTARPLPRMTGYQFAVPLPSLVLAYRLYQDAGRADQIVAENKIVHPAFCPPSGIALSA